VPVIGSLAEAKTDTIIATITTSSATLTRTKRSVDQREGARAIAASVTAEPAETAVDIEVTP
jgi:hypothetical protein